MAWTYVASTSAGGSTGTSLTGISRPSTTVGDWIVLSFATVFASGKTLAFSNGTWTLIRRDVASNNLEGFIYVSRYNGEGSTFDITWDGASITRAAALSAYRGGAVGSAGDPAAPTGTAQLSNPGPTISFLGFTPSVANDLIVYDAPNSFGSAVAVGAVSGTTPTLNQRVQLIDVAQGDGIQTTAVAIGNRTASTGTTNWIGHLFAFTLVAPAVSVAVNWLGSSSLSVTTATIVGVSWQATSSFAVTQATMVFPYLAVGWWKADALALADGDPVASWPDSSGNGHAMANSNTAERPLFRTNIKNTKPAVRFDGANDRLFTTDTRPLTAFECVAVLIPRAIANANPVMGTVAGGWTWGLRMETPPWWEAQTWDGSDKSAHSTTAPVVGTAVIVAGDMANGAATHVRIMNVLEGTGPVAGTILSPITEFNLGRNANGSDPFTGDVLEVLYWERVLSTTERADVYQQLLIKYFPIEVAVSWQATSILTVTPLAPVAVAVTWAATSTFGVGLYTLLAVAWAGTSTWAVAAIAMFPPTPAVRTIVARQRSQYVVAPARPLTIVADPEGARA